MTHHIDPAQHCGQRVAVADVDTMTLGRDVRVGTVSRGQHGVDGDDVVPGLVQRDAYPSTDEAGSAGH
jgi:hypothetical protein